VLTIDCCRQLAENSGVRGRELVATLSAAHENGQAAAAFDIDQDTAAVIDAKEAQILDLLVVKLWGLKYAVGAAATVLRVDQIIMAKRAGGPKPRGGGPMDQVNARS
jgi:T-complex protein 1 subunit theta